MPHQFSASFYHRNVKWLQLTKIAISMYLFGEKLMFYHLGMLYRCVSHNITHKKIMMCLNDKCITLPAPHNLNFCICLAKPLNDGYLYFKSSVIFSSFQPVCSMTNIDHKLISQANKRMFYSPLIIWKDEKSYFVHICPGKFSR